MHTYAYLSLNSHMQSITCAPIIFIANRYSTLSRWLEDIFASTPVRIRLYRGEERESPPRDSQFFHHFPRTSIGPFQIIGDPQADLFVALAASGHNGTTMLPHRAVKP